jgi:hypothetical protein
MTVGELIKRLSTQDQALYVITGPSGNALQLVPFHLLAENDAEVYDVIVRG